MSNILFLCTHYARVSLFHICKALFGSRSEGGSFSSIRNHSPRTLKYLSALSLKHRFEVVSPIQAWDLQLGRNVQKRLYFKQITDLQHQNSCPTTRNPFPPGPPPQSCSLSLCFNDLLSDFTGFLFLLFPNHHRPYEVVQLVPPSLPCPTIQKAITVGCSCHLSGCFIILNCISSS